MNISIVILTKNSEKDIAHTINSVKNLSADIVVVDDYSSDNTVEIAKKLKARVFSHSLNQDFAQQREFAKNKTKGDWIFYIDSDERITPELTQEIKNVTKSPQASAYAVSRENVILGKVMIHGGWWPDYVERLFKKDDLKKWEGKLHERPVFNGSLGYLKNPLTHLKHDNLSSMVEKTNNWSQIEGKLMFDNNHPKMVPWRFVRIMITESWLRLFKNQGIKDGPEGVIYSLYQMWSKFLSYLKLWEMQEGK